MPSHTVAERDKKDIKTSNGKPVKERAPKQPKLGGQAGKAQEAMLARKALLESI